MEIEIGKHQVSQLGDPVLQIRDAAEVGALLTLAADQGTLVPVIARSLLPARNTDFFGDSLGSFLKSVWFFSQKLIAKDKGSLPSALPTYLTSELRGKRKNHTRARVVIRQAMGGLRVLQALWASLALTNHNRSKHEQANLGWPLPPSQTVLTANSSSIRVAHANESI